MIKKTHHKIKRILFYTGIPRCFRATHIAHLFEISQRYPVILLSEKLDSETEKILTDKELFPKLEKVIPVRQFDQRINPFVKNRELCRLAKRVIQCYKPNIFIFGDMPFELYLVRFAKKTKLLQLAFQGAFMANMREVRLLNLLNSSFKWPAFLPISVRILLSKFKKHLGHFFYYWILPLSIGQRPFVRKSSFILMGKPIFPTVDYYIVFSKRDYDLCVQDGMPPEKLYILPHPLRREKTRKFFERIYFSKFHLKNKIKTLTVMWPEVDMGFERANLTPISEIKTQKDRKEIITLITKILKGWKIFIKPHPLTQNISELVQTFESVSNNIKVVNPSEPVDKYIEISEVIVGLPPVSTTLFTASLQCPEKIILSLDLDHQLLGDCYKDFNGVEYIDNEEELISTLELISDKKYVKKQQLQREPNEFSSGLEVLEYLLSKKGVNI